MADSQKTKKRNNPSGASPGEASPGEVPPETSQKIDPMQLELLELFSSRHFSKQELIDIKKMISDYYFDEADDAMDKLFEEKGWDVDEKVKEWGKGHYR